MRMARQDGGRKWSPSVADTLMVRFPLGQGWQVVGINGSGMWTCQSVSGRVRCWVIHGGVWDVGVEACG